MSEKELKLCIECNGTMKYEDGVAYGLVECDRCFFGFEPEDGMCPEALEKLPRKDKYEGWETAE